MNINNEFDFSTIVPMSQYIGGLVQYCEKVSNHYLQLIEQDKERNEKLKYEYKEFQYGEKYGTGLKVVIYDKSFRYIECNDFLSYSQAIQNKQINNIDSLEIRLEINFKRGTGNNCKAYNNEFIVRFRPYDIKFTRKANFNDDMMKQIENNINELLKKFPAVDTIFCTKQNNFNH